MPEQTNEENDPLIPPLRPDLEVYSGPQDPDGSPTYSIYDPVTGVYHKIGWAEAGIIERLRHPVKLSVLYQHVSQTTSIDITPDEMQQFINQLIVSGLTTAGEVKNVSDLLKEKENRKMGLGKWLITHYLYFRIPLIYPEKFLKKTLPVVGLLSSRLACYIYGLFALIGIFFLLENSSSYFTTFPRFFNWKGVAIYSIAVICIKAIHEFSHSYTATSLGVRVRSMGIAFMVFWPIPFCDVTDAWKLDRKRFRAKIGLAGVAAECVIAGITLFLWGISPEGAMKSLFFITSSASLLSTLLVNLNPAMRFDGYYIVSDAWGIENLQPRAFAITKWKLRKSLLGINDPPPEKIHSARRLIALMAYSMYTWLYRIGLYVGIALLVYYKFTKIIGISLFMVEIIMFLLRPIVTEIKTLYAFRSKITLNLRFITSAILLVLAASWLAFPLKRSENLPSIILPEKSQIIYTPASGKIYDVKTSRGQKIKAGNPILSIYSENQLAEIRINEIDKKILEIQAQNLLESKEGRALLPQKKEEISRINAKLTELNERLKLNHITAKIDGTICEWDPRIRNGLYTKAHTALGRIATIDNIFVNTYVPEHYLQDIHVGQEVYFMPADYPRKIPGKIRMISPVREKTLEYKSLSSMSKGDIAVVPNEKGELVMVDSYYIVEVDLEKIPEDIRLGQSGNLWIKTEPRSKLLDFLQHARRILLRESNF